MDKVTMNALELSRSLGNFVAITKSRLAGKSYVPHPRKSIFIETSGRCNLACRFCAYAKITPGGFMTNEDFSQTLE
jgi:MoaA/NifB/PqqE/SkfB family radical SAM enzyme